MAESLIDESSSKTQIILLLILAVSMVSSASIFIRLSTSPPLVIVFWRTLYGALLMAVIGAARRDFSALRKPVVRENWHWLIAIGVTLSLHFSTWFQSLSMTSIAASVVLVNSSPIFTALLSTLILGESLRRRSWVGIIIAVVGAVFLAWGDFGGTDFVALTGDLLALTGALFLALYFIGGRRFAKEMPITVYTSVIYFIAAITTLGFCIPLNLNVLVFEPTEVMIFIGLAIFPTVLGHSVNNYLLTKVPAYVVSSAVLGEPIGATILAALIFFELPGPTTIIGFIVILIGVAMVLADIVTKERSRVSSLDDTNGS
ncbi:MAG: DMT family transporter [Candidatus Thorarchaeota archaeon]|nr:DMT family transporter [Candidatus Thorarchaeota archaeon]